MVEAFCQVHGSVLALDLASFYALQKLERASFEECQDMIQADSGAVNALHQTETAET